MFKIFKKKELSEAVTLSSQGLPRSSDHGGGKKGGKCDQRLPQMEAQGF